MLPRGKSTGNAVAPRYAQKRVKGVRKCSVVQHSARKIDNRGEEREEREAERGAGGREREEKGCRERERRKENIDKDVVKNFQS